MERSKLVLIIVLTYVIAFATAILTLPEEVNVKYEDTHSETEIDYLLFLFDASIRHPYEMKKEEMDYMFHLMGAYGLSEGQTFRLLEERDARESIR